MTRSEIVLGLPFYGRYFNVTSSANGGLYEDPQSVGVRSRFAKASGSRA